MKANSAEIRDRQRDDTQYCVHQLFEQRVEERPTVTALIYQGQRITYGDLNARANQLARFFRKRGVGPETLVGLSSRLSPDAVAAVFGVLKAGGAYVPLDADHPTLRLQELIDDSKLSTVITTTEGRSSNVPSSGVQILALDLVRTQIAAEESSNIDSCTTPDNTTYILYTSGSTGKPKGVVATHRGITNGLAAIPLHVSEDEVCALNTPISVGFTLSRLFLPLLTGLPLAVIPEHISKTPGALVDALEEAQVTNVALVTDFLREVLVSVPSLASRLRKVRTVTVGGSAVTSDLVESFRRALPHADLLNGYAATEIGGAAVVWAISGDYPEQRLSSGRPFPNTEIYLLDEAMNLVADGEPGEIYVGARHLARGYLRQPGLTAERFLPNPFSVRAGERMYRTGDLGTRDTNGQIEILGRVDHQVKVRGFRVELGEIEGVLLRHESIKECAVVADAIENDNRLIAYVVEGPSTELTVSALNGWLKDRVPSHMVPSTFVFLHELPKITSGKLNRQALPAPPATRPELDVEYQPPRNETEAAIAGVWSEVLGLDEIGIYDEFLQLGGHSLLAIQIALGVEERLDIDLPPQWFLETPTIAELASRLQLRHDENDRRTG
jgi:amino acid adenylation domain-containing protein